MLSIIFWRLLPLPDINIIDLKNMKLHKPQVHYDLPASGRRLMQFADGYVATIVSGQVIYFEGKSTGASMSIFSEN